MLVIINYPSQPLDRPFSQQPAGGVGGCCSALRSAAHVHCPGGALLGRPFLQGAVAAGRRHTTQKIISCSLFQRAGVHPTCRSCVCRAVVVRTSHGMPAWRQGDTSQGAFQPASNSYTSQRWRRHDSRLALSFVHAKGECRDAFAARGMYTGPFWKNVCSCRCLLPLARLHHW